MSEPLSREAQLLALAEEQRRRAKAETDLAILRRLAREAAASIDRGFRVAGDAGLVDALRRSALALLGALALLVPTPAAAGWVECGLAGVHASATSQPPAVFSQWGTHLAPGVAVHEWATVDVTDSVPWDAECVHLTGILMITSGTNVRTCDLQVGFRRHGSHRRASKGAQTVLSENTGVRTNFGRWVPLVTLPDGRKVFEVKVEAYNAGDFPDTWFDSDRRYPEWCAFGVVAWADAYGR